jgi:hypothetical protein
MKNTILGSCAVLALAIGSASAETTIVGTCPKADVQQSVPAGDKSGHVFAVVQGKCATSGSIAGVKSKDGAYAAHSDVTPTRNKSWGVYIETYEGGDKITYTYHLSIVLKDGITQSGKGAYQAIRGTGKMKGIKATGTCDYSGGPNDAINFTCSGDSTLPGSASTAK